ncbi:3-ketoacyl-ACP reductase [Fulvivirgaceae bacterium BMA12]|uniref:3-ketoacyl-ACP reductase n=1 Tax=Agaribacillus aureus TaxID=3051825 RepID=A0ABT8L3A6_9BACT|nr:3-ketoacyl-ACP reductase [Fulvivirgaceae bacterium BMA12]
MEKTALITGGSRGIGLGIAEKLASEGYDLVINGVRPEDAVMDVLERLKTFGVKVSYCSGNIGVAEDREKIHAFVEKLHGNINVLVNNAGVAPLERKDVLETSEESYDRVMDINLKGTYFLTQSIANWMVALKQANKEHQSCIINISSISATIASVNRAEYCISKAGMSMLTQLFAVRLGDFGIPVYEVRPGIIETDMTSAVKEKYDALISEGLTLQKRWGSTDDVGKAVAALVRNDFPYSTGQVIMVDGGLTTARL